MFMKALGISMIVVCIGVLIWLGIELYYILVIEYSPIIQGVVVFVTLIGLVYAILWMNEHPMPDSED